MMGGRNTFSGGAGRAEPGIAVFESLGGGQEDKQM
jgi:hypothetical protein